MSGKTALISGSLVFDTLFDLANPIRDQIIVKDGKADKQNLMFGAMEKRVYFGGTAGNIAYGISLLGSSAIVASVVGKDFGDYRGQLKKKGLESRIFLDNSGYTATFYGMSDPNREQIGIFQGNAYHKHVDRLPLSKLLRDSDWKNIGIGIFAAGTAKSISKNIKEFKKRAPKDAIAIFDPGQMLMIDFTESTIAESLKYADMIIVNDAELFHLKNHFGFTLEKIFSLGPKYVIETRGADGSVLHEAHKKTEVKSLKVKKVVDPTGAGDAYRAGLISGMLAGKSIEESMKIGAKLGAACVKHSGGQTYAI
ncbi:MAG: PfkB family carbohydrate kinase [Patescibacteria group bacterium]